MRKPGKTDKAIRFFFLSKTNLSERSRLKRFITDLLKKEGKQLGSLSYILCSDEYLLNINRDFLQHDYYTDIITFDMSTSPGFVSGDIYISIDRVRDNAAQLGVSIKEEIHRVIFHGALHLCGYKDKSKSDQDIMRKAEDGYLSAYFK
jgi:probable rRNA maturation factor